MPRSASLVGLARKGVIPQNNSISNCFVFNTVILAAGRLLSAVLYGVSARDPATYGTALFLMIAVAILACWTPARRAIRTDPVQALREE
jgi:ABC-type antimicrobial peptide transport system permease subunit